MIKARLLSLVWASSG